jgi:micrococcal nuclease
MYEYNIEVVSVVDGDTIHADVDLGFDQHVFKTLRLAHINAPEMSTPEGMPAKQHLNELLGSIQPGTMIIRTIKDRKEKYGRYLATILGGVFDDRGNLTVLNVNERMIADGFAIPYL